MRRRRRLVCRRRRCLLSSAATIPRPHRPTGPRRRPMTTTRRSWTWRWRSSRCCKAGSARSRCSRRPTCSPTRPAACSLRLSSFARSSSFTSSHQSSRLDVRDRILHAFVCVRVRTYIRTYTCRLSWGRRWRMYVPVRNDRMGAGVGV